MIEINALSAYYDDFQALFDIDMSLETGKMLALVGANGAGKTSLLNSICGLVQTSGEIIFDSENINEMKASNRAKQGIALSPEGRRMFVSLSVKENLQMGEVVARNGYWNLETVTQLFPILGEFFDRPAGLLSGGQQQMVAIGRALMANPKLLLLDEVSLGLAPVVIQEVHDALKKIRQSSPVSIILVEQDVKLALSASDEFVCLLEGRCVLKGHSATADFDALSKAYFGEVA